MIERSKRDAEKINGAAITPTANKHFARTIVGIERRLVQRVQSPIRLPGHKVRGLFNAEAKRQDDEVGLRVQLGSARIVALNEGHVSIWVYVEVTHDNGSRAKLSMAEDLLILVDDSPSNIVRGPHNPVENRQVGSGHCAVLLRPFDDPRVKKPMMATQLQMHRLGEQVEDSPLGTYQDKRRGACDATSTSAEDPHPGALNAGLDAT